MLVDSMFNTIFSLRNLCQSMDTLNMTLRTMERIIEISEQRNFSTYKLLPALFSYLDMSQLSHQNLEKIWNIFQYLCQHDMLALQVSTIPILKLASKSSHLLVNNQYCSVKISELCVNHFGAGESWRHGVFHDTYSCGTDKQVALVIFAF